MKVKEEFKSRVYTDRPAYADYDAPRKFLANFPEGKIAHGKIHIVGVQKSEAKPSPA